MAHRCDNLSQRRRIAYLNMEDPTQRCPVGWKLITTPVQACGRATSLPGGCNSATYSSSGVPYSRVCGRITGYQQGSPNAFGGSSVCGGINPLPSVVLSSSLKKGSTYQWQIGQPILRHQCFPWQPDLQLELHKNFKTTYLDAYL